MLGDIQIVARVLERGYHLTRGDRSGSISDRIDKRLQQRMNRHQVPAAGSEPETHICNSFPAGASTLELGVLFQLSLLVDHRICNSPTRSSFRIWIDFLAHDRMGRLAVCFVERLSRALAGTVDRAFQGPQPVNFLG